MDALDEGLHRNGQVFEDFLPLQEVLTAAFGDSVRVPSGTAAGGVPFGGYVAGGFELLEGTVESGTVHFGIRDGVFSELDTQFVTVSGPVVRKQKQNNGLHEPVQIPHRAGARSVRPVPATQSSRHITLPSFHNPGATWRCPTSVFYRLEGIDVKLP